MSAPVLGVDPGLKGAAVLRAPGADPLFWACWSPCARGIRVRFSVGEVVVSDFVDVGLLIAGYVIPLGCSQVIVEQPIPKDFSSMTLAESCGALIAGLCRGRLPAPSARPCAVERRKGRKGWRMAVLCIPNSIRADRAEAIAIEAAMQEGWLPRGLSQAEQGAVAEARFIAQFDGVST